MSDDVLLLSSQLSPVNCVVTTLSALSHEVARPMMTTTNSNAVEEDVIIDRNRSLPYPLRVAGASVGALCLLAGVVGNLLVLLCVWRYRPLRRTVNVFVASLAVCDLIQTLAVRTLHVQTYVAGYWTLGTRTCVYALVIGNLVILEDISGRLRDRPTVTECGGFRRSSKT